MRSWLFVPGDSEKKLAKVTGSAADAIIIDWEDSVAPSRKQAARDITLGFLSDLGKAESSSLPNLYIRVNPLDGAFFEPDMQALEAQSLAIVSGVVQPKTLGGSSVTAAGSRLSVVEAVSDLPDGHFKIMAIATETAASLFSLGTYHGASSRLSGLSWGAEDLAADLGTVERRDAKGVYTHPFQLARTLCLAGASAANTDAIDTVFTDIKNQEGLQTEAEEARRDGFVGKLAIHPAQVETINQVFTPSQEALDWARAIVDAFTADPDAGVLAIDGKMIDRPHVIQAERLLARAEKFST